MDVETVVADLDTLVQMAQKFVTEEPQFVTKLTAVVAAVKQLLPTGTIHGLVTGAKADLTKLESLFKKK